MARDPFKEDELEKIREMFRQLIEKEDMFSELTFQSIGIGKVGDEIRVSVQGDVSEEEIKKLKEKYPNAKFTINNEVGKEEFKETEDEQDLEESDKEELDPEKLALKRFKEKKKE